MTSFRFLHRVPPLTPNNDGCGPDGPVAYTVDVTFIVTDCNDNQSDPLICLGAVKVEDNTPPVWSVNACETLGMTTLVADENCQVEMPGLACNCTVAVV